MTSQPKIYVAGHRGMVGSAIVRTLDQQGQTNTRKAIEAKSGLPWYVVHTKARQEQPACENLARQGYAVYLPRIKVIKRIRGRRRPCWSPCSRATSFCSPHRPPTRWPRCAPPWAWLGGTQAQLLMGRGIGFVDVQLQAPRLSLRATTRNPWIPAFAGMTSFPGMTAALASTLGLAPIEARH